MRGLPRQFFLRGALALAPDLLGKLLVHRTAGGITAGIIVEVEAYCGLRDPAAHSFRGPPSGRTAVMYGAGGRAYVYLIYGMYSCMNVVAGPEGEPEGVLIRALEPVQGLDIMAARRYPGREADVPLTNAQLKGLCSGPGKLAAAMGNTREQYALSLWDSPLMVAERDEARAFDIDASPRIGVAYAGQAAAWPYRFTVRGSPWLSRRAEPLCSGQ